MQMQTQLYTHKTQALYLCQWVPATIWYWLLEQLYSKCSMEHCLSHACFVSYAVTSMLTGWLCPGICQASLDDPVCMRIPQGWYYGPQSKWIQQHIDPAHHDQSYFIKIKRNLYSSKQAAHNWYMSLVKGLKACGFTDPQLTLAFSFSPSAL